MNTKIFDKYFLVLAVAAMAVLNSSQAQAQETSKPTLVFPISELGNCASSSACKTYCNQLANVEACTNYGKEHGLVTSDEAAASLKFKAFKTGPGGCKDKESCKTYCTDTNHTDECVKFATTHKLADTGEIEKFRKFQEAVKEKKTPGGCRDEQTCETFCQLPSNNGQCLKFVKENALVEPERMVKIEKFQEALKNGETPGDCDSKDKCSTYCADKTHRNECAEFAEDQGLIKPEEAKRLKESVLEPKDEEPRPSYQKTDKPELVLTRIPAALRECILKAHGAEFVRQLEAGILKTSDASVKEKITRCVLEQQKPALETKPPVKPVLKPDTTRDPDSSVQKEIVKEPFNSDQ